MMDWTWILAVLALIGGLVHVVPQLRPIADKSLGWKYLTLRTVAGIGTVFLVWTTFF